MLRGDLLACQRIFIEAHERNGLSAELVERAEIWRWSSLFVGEKIRMNCARVLGKWPGGWVE